MKKLTILVLLFSLVSTQFIDAQSRSTKNDKFQTQYVQTKSTVKSKNYNYVGEAVFVEGNRKVLEAGSNSISVKGNQVSLKIQDITLENTISFSGKLNDYRANFDDSKQNITIQFTADNVSYFIEIKKNGNAFLTVKSENGAITQIGNIKS